MNGIDVAARHEIINREEGPLVEDLSISLAFIASTVGFEGVHMPLKVRVRLLV